MVRGLLAGLRERVRESRRRREEAARALEARGVPRAQARRLAGLVASGEYTLDEVLEAYRRARKGRVKALSKRLSQSGVSSLDRLASVESGLWDAVGLSSPSGSTRHSRTSGRRRRRRR